MINVDSLENQAGSDEEREGGNGVNKMIVCTYRSVLVRPVNTASNPDSLYETLRIRHLAPNSSSNVRERAHITQTALTALVCVTESTLLRMLA